MKFSPQERAFEGETQHLDYGLDKQGDETTKVSKAELLYASQKSKAKQTNLCHAMCHHSHVIIVQYLDSKKDDRKITDQSLNYIN